MLPVLLIAASAFLALDTRPEFAARLAAGLTTGLAPSAFC